MMKILKFTKQTEPVSEPLLIVLSGPSGVGKDAVMSRMIELKKPFHYTVTVTTRLRRPLERDGIDYQFVSDQDFQTMLDAGELLEYAEVYGYMYGVPKTQVVDALQSGKDVLVKTDVQGAITIRRLIHNTIVIYLVAPNPKELIHRLEQRMTESVESLELRIKTARNENEMAGDFDYVVVNNTGRLNEAVSEIEMIVARERNRTQGCGDVT